jgi:hypothetical protein
MEQGFDPDYTIADGRSGLRAGQKAVMPETGVVQARVTLSGRHQSFKVQLNQLLKDFPRTQSVTLAKPMLNHAQMGSI